MPSSPLYHQYQQRDPGDQAKADQDDDVRRSISSYALLQNISDLSLDILQIVVILPHVLIQRYHVLQKIVREAGPVGRQY
jgi:hypothetical protein